MTWWSTQGKMDRSPPVINLAPVKATSLEELMAFQVPLRTVHKRQKYNNLASNALKNWVSGPFPSCQKV